MINLPVFPIVIPALAAILMMFMPKKWAHEMHDRNADWAFSLGRYDELKLEQQK